MQRTPPPPPKKNYSLLKIRWKILQFIQWNFPDSKVHGANMGPTWGRQDPGGPHVGHVNLAIWVLLQDNSSIEKEVKLLDNILEIKPGVSFTYTNELNQHPKLGQK